MTVNSRPYITCAGCGTEIVDISTTDKPEWRHVKGFGVRMGCTIARPLLP